MKKLCIKKLLLISIVLTLSVFVSVFNSYLKNDEKVIGTEYLALDSTTALKSISLKKDLIDKKDYYAPGENIKYKIEIINNNSETIKLNMIDNISNLELVQNNVIIKSAKCNGESITEVNNQILLNDIELASKATFTCEVEAVTNEKFFEGNVNSRVRVYIDDEDEYIDSGFNYIVKDSYLDIQLNDFTKRNYGDEENVIYQIKIKNISETETSGKIVLSADYYKTLRLNEPYKEYITYSLNGVTDNSKVKIKCVADDGGTCVIDQAQHLTLTMPELAPGDIMHLTMKFRNNATGRYTMNFNSNLEEIDSDGNIKKGVHSVFDITFARSYDFTPNLYPVDINGNKIDDISDLEFKNGKADLYLNYDFYRLPDYENSRSSSPSGATVTLPANVEYNAIKNIQNNGCGNAYGGWEGGAVLDVNLNSSNLYELRLKCGMGNQNDYYIYNANVKVPITINNRLYNQKICFDGRWGANNYCIGPSLSVNNLNAKQENDIIDVELQLFNKGYGRGTDVAVTYKYDEGLEIIPDSLPVNTILDSNNRTITFNVPLIYPNTLPVITFKAKNTNNLKMLTAKGEIAGSAYSHSTSIVGADSGDTENGDGKEVVKGDWNQNGKLDLLDLPLCRKYLAAYEGITKPELEIIDMNDDGEFNIIDLSLLRRYFATSYNPK